MKMSSLKMSSLKISSLRIPSLLPTADHGRDVEDAKRNHSKVPNRRMAGARIDHRVGLTLPEVLIALSITLVILLAMMQAFSVASKDIGAGRNRLILAERVRSAADLIRSDLEQLSLNVRPTVTASENLGFFEYVDGGLRDMSYSGTASSILGDVDDVLMFTVKSTGEPFRGRFDGQMIQSSEAEVIYFTSWTDTDGNGFKNYGDQIRIHRRMLLIRPDLIGAIQSTDATVNVIFKNAVAYDTYINGNPALDPTLKNRSEYAKFLQFNDVSLSWDQVDPVVTVGSETFRRMRPNSLGSLFNPKNRTGHHASLFPHPAIVDGRPGYRPETFISDLILQGTGTGNDVVMENVVGFDVKIFDPSIEVFAFAGQPVLPHDPGYGIQRLAASSDATVVQVQGFGGFVDLGAFEYRAINGTPGIANNFAASVAENYNFAYWRQRTVAGSNFIANQPAPNYYLGPAANTIEIYEIYATGPTYSTWTKDFENDGIDNDQDGLIDEGSDGLPSGNGMPDMRNDADSAPPYNFPVSAVQVTLRTASFDADRLQTRATDQVIQSQVVVSTSNQ